MINTSSAGIDSSMDAHMENEVQNFDLNQDMEDEDFDDDDDDDDIIIIQDGPLELDINDNEENSSIPLEVVKYVDSLEAQTQNLERELVECDELINHSSRPYQGPVDAVIVYDEYKELEAAAAEQGMTVEELKQKLLNDIEGESFTEDDVDKEYEEFLQLQEELAQLRAETADIVKDKELQQTDDKLLAIEAPDTDSKLDRSSSPHENGVNEEVFITDVSDALTGAPSDDRVSKDNMDSEVEAGPLVAVSVLSNMRDFIQEQLKNSEQSYQVRKQRLLQNMEIHRNQEEKRMLQDEEKRKEFQLMLEDEERQLLLKKEELERRMEQEIKEMDEVTLQELNLQQAQIERWSEVLEEERRQFETFRKEADALEDTSKQKAATEIQRRYRGFRTRKEMASTIQELEEMKELKKKERYDVRLMEVEYEIKYREEQLKKEKEENEKKEKEEQLQKDEEERQKEIERKKKEEEEKLKEEVRKEEEKRREVERLEEERKKKEMEEKKKEEERQRKEEEQLRKEEEKKQKAEEKKRQKEEEKKRKEEEKKRKEEEKRLKEEEKKLKAEEEKKKKAEKEAEKASVLDVEKQNMDKEKIQNSCDIQGKENESLQDNDKKVNGVCEDSNTDNQQIKTSTEDMLRKSVVSASQVPDTTSHKEGSVVSDPSRKSNHDSEEQPRTPPASGRKSKASTSSPVMKFMPHPPSRPPSAGPEVTDATTISSASTKSAEALVSGAAVVATTATTKTAAEAVTVTEIKPMAPTPIGEQAPVLQKQEDPVEKQRLAWMKNCVPWSKVSNEPWRLKPNAQRSHKRPSSAKKLPALSEAVILSAAQAATLRQVSSVELTSLPGCSLSTLSQCWSLRYLTVTNCGLICLDGLSQCKHLHYVNAEHNNIEHLDLKDLGSLQVLRLAHNRLNIVHGLEGCINLRWLDLSHNRITKLSGLGALRRLHTLRACHNQLVSTEGLEEVVTLQRLELSHNYLQALTKLSRMCLLTFLDVSANNLQKVPEFSNQVLLQHLNLRENSIKSLEDCSKCWLPLLESLNCGQNMLENLNGIDKLITLSELDVSSNQITEPEVVTEGLHLSGKLSSLVLEGNPLVDVYFNEYRDILFKALPMVSCIDGVQRQGAADLGPENTDDDFTLMCLSQTAAHKKLAMNFDAQLQEHEVSAPGASDNLCSCFFTFCDTSFKMAAEHRSSHEYGDISVTSSISDFTTTVSTDLSSKMSKFNSTDTDKVTTGDVTDRKSKFEAAVAAQGHLMSSENFPESARSSINGNHSTASVSNNKSKGSQRNSGLSSSVKSVTEKSKLLSSVEAGHTPVLNTGANKKKVLDDSTDSSDSDSEAENDPSLYPSATDHQKRLQVMAPQSAAPTAASYMNEKDKFEMALQGKSTAASHDRNIQHGVNDRRHSKPQNDTLHSSSYGVSSSQHHSSQYSTNNLHSMPDSARLGQKDLFERAVQQQQQTATATPTAVSAKAMFDMAVSGGGSSSSMGIQPETMRARSIPSGGTDFNPQHGVKANVVGNQLMEEPGEDLLNDLDLAALGMDGDFSFDGLDFDIDKYLDMNDLDEFLEKGWRPAESPQIPQSSYPVLGKIGSAESNFNNNHNGMRKPIQDSSLHRTGLGMTAPPPPMQPSHAWKDAPVPELMGKPPRPSPLPAPSPSPSSVASAAETLGGGSIRSKKDELSDEWGFKDSRTAELMMARAKKMKYNAERKRKLSKLDPRQRLQLFRRLEESGKIHPVRPPPAKVLPRKEYFQAREEEVQRQELERRVEEHARVNRTFEWLHTQVGDHPVSSSRINPGPGAMHTHSDSNMSKNPHNFDYGPRKTSPGSDYMDSVSAHGGHGGHRLGRRFSTEEAHAGNSPMLPPIQIGAVPSTHKDERMSWRNEQVDKSLGWGGGKKRGKN